jgi:hypothetical protein
LPGAGGDRTVEVVAVLRKGGDMPPHCDSLDGPVVGAARRALEAGRVELVLPFVPAAGEAEVTTVFETAMAIRGLGTEVAAVADRWFFENVVRIHRSGEGAPYTGLKPAGLDVGPVIPVAERALTTGSGDELIGVLSDVVAGQVKERLDHALHLASRAGAGVPSAREYVDAMLGLQVWAHHVYLAALAPAHGGEGHHEG